MTVKCSNCGRNVNLNKFEICPKCAHLGKNKMLSESLQDADKHFVKLIAKLNSIQNNKLSKTDQRLTIVVKLRELSTWADMITKTYASLMMKANSPIPKYLKSQNKKMTDEYIKQLVSNFDLINRASYLTMFLFLIENFMGSVNRQLASKCQKCGYAKLAIHLFNELNISNPNNEKFDVLNVPALVRNCLHSEGKHMRKSEHGKVDGILFKFTTGQTHNYGSWEHTCFFCDKMINVLKEILNSQFVKKTQIPI